jgi:hypothetical protein
VELHGRSLVELQNLTTIDIAADASWWSHDVGHHQPAGISDMS